MFMYKYPYTQFIYLEVTYDNCTTVGVGMPFFNKNNLEIKYYVAVLTLRFIEYNLMW